LPESAKKYGAWWANNRTSQPHSRAWLDAGRRVSLDFQGGVATFTLDPSVSDVNQVESEELSEAQGLLSGFVESSISLERDLEDHLVANIGRIEPGLKFVSRQTSTDVGRVDILAKSASDETVIIEIKVGEARDSAVGQVARYIGWYTREESKAPRAILIAASFSEPVRFAALALPTLKLVSYRVSFDFGEVSL
jgi:RecB family endonuclease NucS